MGASDRRVGWFTRWRLIYGLGLRYQVFVERKILRIEAYE